MSPLSIVTLLVLRRGAWVLRDEISHYVRNDKGGALGLLLDALIRRQLVLNQRFGWVAAINNHMRINSH
jgi:hypothetical protein